MAFPTSAAKGWYKQPILLQMNTSGAGIVSSASSGMRFALYTDVFDSATSLTSGYDSHTSIAAAPYTSNECTPTTAGYLAGGWACSGVQWAVSGAGVLALIVGPVGNTSTTVSAARGGILYHNSTTVKYPAVTSWFGGADYASSNGIFSVSWTNGIAFQII